MPINMSYCRIENTLAALRELNDTPTHYLSHDDKRHLSDLLCECDRCINDWDGYEWRLEAVEAEAEEGQG